MVNGAIGGSTNAVVHLLAIAGRIGVDLSLDDWDRLGRDMPCLVDLQPSGQYLMEDFYYAGGLPVVIKEIGRFLHKKALTVNGRTIWDNCKDAVNFNEKVITPIGTPFKPSGGIAVLRGNLAPSGCVLKPSAATPALMKHRAGAVVFEDVEDLHARIDDPKLDVDPDCVLVLKNCGPRAIPDFRRSAISRCPRKPEAGHHRHGSHLRCADVRHRLRHGGPSHGTRSRGGRPARAGAQRGSHRDRRGQAQDPPSRLGPGAREAQAQVEALAAARGSRLGEALLRHGVGRPIAASTSISWSAIRAPRWGAKATRACQHALDLGGRL